MDIRTFFVTQDREKSTHSVEGAAAQESTDSVINFVHASPPPPPPPPPPTLYCCARLCAYLSSFPLMCFILSEWIPVCRNSVMLNSVKLNSVKLKTGLNPKFEKFLSHMQKQSNHATFKNRSRCQAKSPTVQDASRPILVSCEYGYPQFLGPWFLKAFEIWGPHHKIFT